MLSLWHRLSPFARDLISRVFFTLVIAGTAYAITVSADWPPQVALLVVIAIQFIKNYAVAFLDREPVLPSSDIERTVSTLIQTAVALLIVTLPSIPSAWVVPVVGVLALIKGLIARSLGDPDDASVLPIQVDPGVDQSGDDLVGAFEEEGIQPPNEPDLFQDEV